MGVVCAQVGACEWTTEVQVGTTGAGSIGYKVNEVECLTGRWAHAVMFIVLGGSKLGRRSIGRDTDV